MPTDVWSVREKLALASSVMRSGDQNWVSVSRAVRPFGNPGRPDDWFSQKNCAVQYSALLEKVETPRRKRGEREVTETPGDVIVRKLTIERIEELKRIIQDESARYRSIKKDLELVRSGHVDHKIKEMWGKLQAEKVAVKEAAARKAADELQARELAKAAAASRLKKPLLLSIGRGISINASDHEDSTQDSVFDTFNNEDSNQSAATPGTMRLTDGAVAGPSTPSSPLLSMLLSASKPSELLYRHSDDQNAELPDVSAIAALIDEMKQEPVDVSNPASILNTPEDNDMTNVEMPMEASQMLDDAISAVMKDREGDMKAEELLTDFGSPSFMGEIEVASSAEPYVQDAEVVCTADMAVHSSVAGASPTKTSQFNLGTELPCTIGTSADSSSVSMRQVQEFSPVKTEKKSTSDAESESQACSSSRPQTGAEETLEEALSPASSVLSTEAVFAANRPTPTSQKTGRGNRSRPVQKRSSQTRQSESDKSSSKPCDVDTSEDEVASSHTHDESVSDMLNASARQKMNDTNESLPNSPASFSHSDTEDEKAHKIWKKSIMLVWRSAANHKSANVFLHPVTEDIAPGYHSIVHRPMNLSMIKKNIDNGSIRTTAEFQRDMMLLFINAMMYNNIEHDVHKMAVAMYNDVMTHIEHFVNTQMMVQSEPKLLRTLRRTDAHSDKEEESRKRRSSEVEPQPPQQQQQLSTPTAATTGSSAAKKRR